jgi:hypothetical protein
LAGAATFATTAVSLIALAGPAAADDDPLKLGNLQVSPASGVINATDKTGWIESVSTQPGEICPDSHRKWSTFSALYNGTLLTAGWTVGPNQDTAPTIGGLNDGDPRVYREGSYAVSPYAGPTMTFPWSYAADGGTFELRHSCINADTPSYAVTRDYYYAATIEIAPGGAWHVVSSGPAPVEYESELTLALEDEEPTAPAGLKITVRPVQTALTSDLTRVEGVPWQATATLDNITVNDDRRDASAGPWTLSGRSSDFVSGQNTIPATNLGWEPAVVSGAGTAGPQVVPGAGLGLSVDQPLATGAASGARDVQTVVNAGLTLNVPTGTPGGDYTATLTLTLI